MSSMKYPDHYAILTRFKNIPLRKNKVKNGVRETMWNTRKPGGWQRYFKETDKNKVFDRIANVSDKDVEKTFQEIEKELTKIKHKSFGKISIKRNVKIDQEVKKLQQQKIDTADTITSNYC